MCVCQWDRESFLHNSPSGKVKASLREWKERECETTVTENPRWGQLWRSRGGCSIILPGGRKTVSHGHRKDACRLHHAVPPGLGNFPYPPTFPFIFSSLPSSFLWDFLSPLALVSVLSQSGDFYGNYNLRSANPCMAPPDTCLGTSQWDMVLEGRRPRVESYLLYLLGREF